MACATRAFFVFFAIVGSHEMTHTLRSAEPQEKKAISGSELFHEMLGHAAWCQVGLGPDTFVIRKSRLEKPLVCLGGVMKRLNQKKMTSRTKATPGLDCHVAFYAWDGKTTKEVGMIGAWQDGEHGIYIRSADIDGILNVAESDVVAFTNAIKPGLYSIDNAIEGLDVADVRLKCIAMTSLAQRRFREHTNRIVPRVEVYLTDVNPDIKDWSARTILSIDPMHEGARKNKK